VIAYAVILFVVLSRRTHSKEAGGILLFFFKICAAAAPAAVICFEVTRLVEARIRWQSTHGSFIVLVAGTAAGILATVAIAKLLRIREVDRYLGRLRVG
ncbi:MAG: hypothetical protein KGM47_00430, partial [Acidobacteriota bacterium]|nr:hypothetical protein [Acidobacteriota bacterium]